MRVMSESLPPPTIHVQQIALERQLRGPLLERLSRGVRLTPAGRTALPHARASLAHAERASTAAMRASGIDAGELHVGTLYSISVGVLPAVLRRRHALPRPPGPAHPVGLHRVRPDPITAAFVQAICHATLATPAHLQPLLAARPEGDAEPEAASRTGH
jgi:DNA-binding transcriptional LysR family regulator